MTMSRRSPHTPGSSTSLRRVLLTAGMLAATSLPAAAQNLVFTAVPRCRVIDTRLEGGPLRIGDARGFDVAGALEGQGGAADCQVPFGSAAAVVIQLQPVEPAGDGRLAAWPFGGAVPPGPLVEFTPGAVGTATAERLVPLCNPAQAACTRDLVIQTDGNDTHLVADVTGYFSPATRYFAGAGLHLSAGTPLGVATAAVQRRPQSCPPGSWLRAIDANGGVTCEPDDDTVLAAGFGVIRTDGTPRYTAFGYQTQHSFSVSTDAIQKRRWDHCLTGIRSVGTSGELSCAPVIRAGREPAQACGSWPRVNEDNDFASTPTVIVTPEGLEGTPAPPNSYCVVDSVSIGYRFEFSYCCYGHVPQYVNWIAIGVGANGY